jgi:hypothetical protein
MTTTTPAQIRDILTEQQRELLARLDELSPEQLHDALCYLIGGAPDLTSRALDGCPPRNAEHGITMVIVRGLDSSSFRASCLCGWHSPIAPSRPQATAAGAEHMRALSADEVRTRASHCSCGRPAREVLDGGEHGPTGYCGVPGMPPLDECDCGHWSRHDRSVCHIYGAGGSS